MFEQKEELIELMLKLGANPNAQDRDGRTALMHAIDHRDSYTNIVKILIKYGANLNIKDKRGAGAIDYAKGNPPAPNIVNILEMAGAK
jgi:ankyrin repeat protein